MTNSMRDDALWQAAIGWVMLEHECQPGTREALREWLARDPAHRPAYDEAALVWLLTGLIPPSFDTPAPAPGQRG
jgi:ferric-dicitrate binding protein FerR (iron transport regulator)